MGFTLSTFFPYIHVNLLYKTIDTELPFTKLENVTVILVIFYTLFVTP